MKKLLFVFLALASVSAFASTGSERYEIIGCSCETSSFWSNGENAKAVLTVAIFDTKKGTIKKEELATFQTGPTQWGHRQTDVDGLCSNKVEELTQKGKCN